MVIQWLLFACLSVRPLGAPLLLGLSLLVFLVLCVSPVCLSRCRLPCLGAPPFIPLHWLQSYASGGRPHWHTPTTALVLEATNGPKPRKTKKPRKKTLEHSEGPPKPLKTSEKAPRALETWNTHIKMKLPYRLQMASPSADHSAPQKAWASRTTSARANGAATA